MISSPCNQNKTNNLLHVFPYHKVVTLTSPLRGEPNSEAHRVSPGQITHPSAPCSLFVKRRAQAKGTPWAGCISSRIRAALPGLQDPPTVSGGLGWLYGGKKIMGNTQNVLESQVSWKNRAPIYQCMM